MSDKKITSVCRTDNAYENAWMRNLLEVGELLAGRIDDLTAELFLCTHHYQHLVFKRNICWQSNYTTMYPDVLEATSHLQISGLQWMVLRTKESIVATATTVSRLNVYVLGHLPQRQTELFRQMVDGIEW